MLKAFLPVANPYVLDTTINILAMLITPSIIPPFYDGPRMFPMPGDMGNSHKIC